jgi:hypothetical protein
MRFWYTLCIVALVLLKMKIFFGMKTRGLPMNSNKP